MVVIKDPNTNIFVRYVVHIYRLKGYMFVNQHLLDILWRPLWTLLKHGDNLRLLKWLLR
jgi:hypothetical protein